MANFPQWSIWILKRSNCPSVAICTVIKYISFWQRKLNFKRGMWSVLEKSIGNYCHIKRILYWLIGWISCILKFQSTKNNLVVWYQVIRSNLPDSWHVNVFSGVYFCGLWYCLVLLNQTRVTFVTFISLYCNFFFVWKSWTFTTPSKFSPCILSSDVKLNLWRALKFWVRRILT